MLAKMIDKIVSLKETKTFQIDGQTYTDGQLNIVRPPKMEPASIQFHSLDAIVKMVRTELEQIGKRLYISVDDYNGVTVFSTYDDEYSRWFLYCATADAPGFPSGWREIDKALIELRSLCIPEEGAKKLIALLSSVNFDEGMEVRDNGVSQEIKVNSGVSLKQMAKIEPRVELRPFRTFLEVRQPASEFIVRVDKNKGVGIFESDGGVWKLEAKQNIVNYFRGALVDLVDTGKVVVMQ